MSILVCVSQLLIILTDRIVTGKLGFDKTRLGYWTRKHCNAGQCITNTLAGRIGRRFSEAEPVSRALYAAPSPIEDMGVDHGRADIRVPKQLLHRADVVTVLEQVRGEAMTPISSTT